METDYEGAVDQRLVDCLLRLHASADDKSDREARGRLANLRYALRDRLNADYPYARLIGALEAGTLTDNEERNGWRTAIAALFGLAHDEVHNAHNISLGAALRTYHREAQRDSIEPFLMALLNSDEEHLPGHLRHAVGLLRSKDIGIDWRMLLSDAQVWSRTGRRTHKKWTRDFYRAEIAATNENASETDEEETAK